MYVEANRCRVYYEEAGKGAPLLLLHGWGVSSEIFRPMFFRFAKNRHVRVLDFPGFGLSSPPDVSGDNAWGTKEYADTLREILDTWGWQGADILAHSFGCRVSMRLLERDSGSFGKVIFTGAAGLRKKGNVPLSKKIIASAGRFAGYFGPPGAWLKKIIYRRVGSADYLAAEGVMRSILVKVVNEDLSGILPGIKNETLLLWGEDDQATPLDMAAQMERLIPSAKLVSIEGAGHYVFTEKPEEFMRHAEKFLGISG